MSTCLEDKLKIIEDDIKKMNEKLDLILAFLEKDVSENCKKMGEHIDFVEKVYDNVKNPLGYLCNKLNYFSSENDTYTLENLNEHAVLEV
jgi:hypothetical protein